MLVLQGDIMYLQVVDSMMIVVLVFLDGMGKGEELKVPHHASAAATRDNHVPYSRHWQLFFYGCYLHTNNIIKL